MDYLGALMIAFVCSTPANVADGQHDCHSSVYSYHQTLKTCEGKMRDFTEELEAHGLRVVNVTCRTAFENKDMI